MLIKSLLQDDIKTFNEKLKQVISEVPTKHGNKKEFWHYFFLGSILTLPNIKLANELKIKNIGIKLNDSNQDMDLRVTMSSGKTVYRSISLSTKGEIELIEGQEIVDGEFIKIEQVLEEEFALQFEEEEIKGSVEDMFLKLREIYNHNKSNSIKLKPNPEALHQAFIYGFFKMNTNYRCFTEFNAGIGTADLVVVIDDSSIAVVECKVDNNKASDAIEQIKNRGYHHLGILGEFESAYLVGTNFNQEEENEAIIVEKKEILKYSGLINSLMKGEDEKTLQNELLYLCHTQNIGVSNTNNPSNQNSADPENKYVGSFTALLLGQVLQYCGQNQGCKLECVTINEDKKSKMQNAELLITGHNNQIKLEINEFKDKGGNESPHDNESENNYIAKVKISSKTQSYSYKIAFLDEKVDVHKEKSRSNSSTRTKSGRQIKSTKRDDCIYPSSSSQDSSNSPKKLLTERKEVNLNKLISEIKNGKQDYLRDIIISYGDFIHSEANIQLFLKGLFLNAKVGDKQVIAETEVSAGKEGEIDLLVKLPNGQAIILECKFCEKEKQVEGKKKDALNQLKRYTDKGNLNHILDANQHNLIGMVVVFCKEGCSCIIETKLTSDDQSASLSRYSSLQSLDDSGLGSLCPSSRCSSYSDLSQTQLSVTTKSATLTTPIRILRGRVVPESKIQEEEVSDRTYSYQEEPGTSLKDVEATPSNSPDRKKNKR